MLSGRVKTLHPRIHAGILAGATTSATAIARRARHPPFDLVCVNLYPFEDVVAQHGISEAEAVERIDIGGPAMLRAAAKNFAHVPRLASPPATDVLRAARTRELSFETRRGSPSRPSRSAAYEAAIARWFGDREVFPAASSPASGRSSTSPTARTRTSGPPTTPRPAPGAPALAGRAAARARALVQQPERPLGGAPLAREFDAARLRDHQAREPVRRRGRGHDRGGVRGCARRRPGLGVRRRRRRSTGRSARRSARRSRSSSSRCSSRRVRRDRARAAEAEARDADPRGPGAAPRDPGERDFRRVLGGLLVQERDSDIEDRDGMEVVCGAPNETAWGDLLFAWRVCKHVCSNAIVLAQATCRRSASARAR